MPCLWFEARATASAASASKVRQITNLPTIFNIVGTLVVLAGLVGVITTVILRCRKTTTKFQQKQIEELFSESEKTGMISSPDLSVEGLENYSDITEAKLNISRHTTV